MRTLTFGLFMYCLVSYGQDAELLKTYRAATFLTRYSQMGNNLASGDIITSMPNYYEPIEVKGDPYWDKRWGISSVMLVKGNEYIEGYHTRYDINRDEFEFLLRNNEIKVLSGSKVDNMVWLDSTTQLPRFLVSSKQRKYTVDNLPLAGFLEVLVEGENLLFKKIQLEILKPDFNPALNVGSKEEKILKRESFYFAVGASLVRIKSKKSLDALGSDYEQKINQFMKANNIKLNNEGDLVRLFLFLAGK